MMEGIRRLPPMLLQLLCWWSAVAVVAAAAAAVVDAAPADASVPSLQHQFHMATSLTDNEVKDPPAGIVRRSKGSDIDGVTSSSPSVLQLNVIDLDGSLTAIVYPGKQVALELQAAHHGRFGVPVVTKCTVSNPLQQIHSNSQTVPPFSQTILTQGCGLGDVLPNNSGFTRSRTGYTSRFFPLPPSWALQTSLLFTCDVTICADVTRCRQSCPPSTTTTSSSSSPPSARKWRNVTTPARPYDVTVLMESQVVTSCPQRHDGKSQDVGGDVDRSMMYLPACFPEGHPDGQHTAPLSDTGGNVTASASGSDINKESSGTSWLAGHVHYVIIMGVMGLMIILFMLATFCKMIAVQRQVEQCNKMMARVERERILNDHHDQGTQTPRHSSKTTSHRNHPACHSRPNVGDRDLVTIVNVRDSPMRLEKQSQIDNSSESSASSPGSQSKLSLQPTARPYDVPPSRDCQRSLRMSLELASAQGLILPESLQHSSEPQTFHASCSAEQKRPRRHTTEVEMSKPCTQDSTDNRPGVNDRTRVRSFSGASEDLQRSDVIAQSSGRQGTKGEHQEVVDSTRVESSLTTQHHGPANNCLYYNTPAPCSEESTVKELFRSSHEGGSKDMCRFSEMDGGMPESAQQQQFRQSQDRSVQQHSEDLQSRVEGGYADQCSLSTEHASSEKLDRKNRTYVNVDGLKETAHL